MAGGYETPPVDDMAVLTDELRRMRDRITELERPNGSQLASTVARLQAMRALDGTGGVNAFDTGFLTTTTGGVIVWSGAIGPTATISIPSYLEGRVQVQVSGNIEVSGNSSPTTVHSVGGYIGLLMDGVGQGASSLRMYGNGAGGASTILSLDSANTFQLNLSQGDHTLALRYGYFMGGTTVGSQRVNITSANLSFQILR